MRYHNLHNLTRFVKGLEDKKYQLQQDKEYFEASYIKKIIIKLRKYGNSFYINGSGGFYNFDFPLEEDDIDYFINKYKAIIPETEERERKERLLELERNKVKVENEIKELKNGKQF